MKAILIGLILAFTATAIAGQADGRSLVSSLLSASGPIDSATSFRALRKELQNGSAEVRREIVAQLAVNASPVALRLLCEALKGFGTEGAVNTLLSRLEAERSIVLPTRLDELQSIQLQAAILEGLPAIFYRVNLSQSTQQRLLKQLGSIMENRGSPISVLKPAAITCGRIGPAGFDLLCKTAKTNSRMMDVFYGALSGSLDPRAAALIRQGIEDPTLSEGTRRHAVYALGHLFAGWEQSGMRVDEVERAASLDLVEKLVYSASGSSPDQADQLFAAALQSWAKISPSSERLKLRGVILTSLDSGRPRRQSAALDVLYAVPDLQDEEIMVRVRQLAAQSDTTEMGDRVIVTAKDILESRSEVVEDRISRE